MDRRADDTVQQLCFDLAFVRQHASFTSQERRRLPASVAVSAVVPRLLNGSSVVSPGWVKRLIRRAAKGSENGSRFHGVNCLSFCSFKASPSQPRQSRTTAAETPCAY